jgi:hypothetical protein
VGARVAVLGDTWTTSAGVSNVARVRTCYLPSDFDAATVLVEAVGTLGFAVTGAFSLSADVGLGMASSTARDVGGDVFLPQCNASTGAQPAASLGLAARYRLGSVVSAVVRPLQLDVHPAFDGARMAPLDADGAWVHASFALGAAVEF